MLKFFRRIRRKLINDGNLKRYAIYAVGEIILVVIGILIALQINNWNENQKTKAVESKILLEIEKNLHMGLSVLDESFHWDSLCTQSGLIVLKHLEKKLAYHDSLDEHFDLFPNIGLGDVPSSGYDALKSVGLTVLANDSIRIGLSNLYEISLPKLKQTFEYDVFERRTEFYNSELYEHFYMKDKIFQDSAVGRHPINYKELLDDRRFINMTRSLLDNRKWFNSEKVMRRNEILHIIQMINKELYE
ncbi:hypothetical protein GGR28_000594 [Lewinella aquimaris]|uniref:Uncharacterized protein n=1 Tax=Neolewinella aquimaris TaxID=1835722 RepID=A0A840E208_9BACT|nr:DUF6090 family protein [Neolewinella aquimaris]MBB4077993.1 hypothetical protein [Neolewinella aquimaris]